MDLGSIGAKLEAKQYKSRDDFAADVRLMINNCLRYNAPDSPVGQTGKKLGALFEKREWLVPELRIMPEATESR